MLDTLDIARLSGPDTSRRPPAEPSAPCTWSVAGNGPCDRCAPISATGTSTSRACCCTSTPRPARRARSWSTRRPRRSARRRIRPILFKSGTLVDGRLYLTTQTEVLVYRVPSFELRDADLAAVVQRRPPRATHRRRHPAGRRHRPGHGHRGRPSGGEVVREWNVWQPGAARLGRPVLARTSTTGWCPSTKPHLAHPNHVFHIGDEPWATRFQQKDAVSLLDPTRRIDIGLERIHDGIVYGDRVLFTTVDAKVVIADTRTLAGDRGHRPARDARQGPAARLVPRAAARRRPAVGGLLADARRRGSARTWPSSRTASATTWARTSRATTCASDAAWPRSTPRRPASTRCSGSTPPTERTACADAPRTSGSSWVGTTHHGDQALGDQPGEGHARDAHAVRGAPRSGRGSARAVTTWTTRMARERARMRAVARNSVLAANGSRPSAPIRSASGGVLAVRRPEEVQPPLGEHDDRR